MSLKARFSTTELERIKAAVHKAEDKISGEIVPVFVEKSGFYSIANYRAAMVFGSLAFILVIFFDRYYPDFAIYDPLMIFLSIAFVGIVGAVASNYIGPLQKIFVSQYHLDLSTKQRTETPFIQENHSTNPNR